MPLNICKKNLLIIFLFAVGSIVTRAQQSPAEALKKLYEDHPQEKLYLWFNKAAYVNGETIWFKAYVFSGYDVSYISSTLYVELYDINKKLVTTKMFPVLSGVAEGSIDLDGELEAGVYFLRAYTQWMTNFNPSFQYIKQLLIYNPASAKKIELNTSAWKTIAQPEGGSLIEGLETKVAVRRLANAPLLDKWGGYLYEENNPSVKLKEFSSLDENAALFTFTPEARKKYNVYVIDEKGNFKIATLPLVKNTGVKLLIENISDSITYKLKFQNIPENGNGYTVLGQIQHQSVYQAKMKKTGEEILMKIPVGSSDNGVLHITVFDPANNPVAERLVFLNPTKLNYDSAVILQQNISAAPRAKNEMTFAVDSLSWLSYAVSVSDASTTSAIESENILSTLWLSSDFINPIQNPAKYFVEQNKKKIEALDAIMISEKWMRFDWNEIIKNNLPPVPPVPLKYLSFTGRVSKGNKLKPNEEVNIILYFPDSSSQLVLSKTDSMGNVVLDNIGFIGDLKVYYQLNNKKASAKAIDINFERDNKFVTYPISFPETPYSVSISSEKSPAWAERAAKSIKLEKEIANEYKILQEVVVRSNLRSAKEQLNENLSTGLFKSMSEVIFDFINEDQHAQGYMNILQWLQGRVAGLTVQFEDGNYVPYIRNGRAGIYLDEMPIDPSWLNSISVADIAMIKVIRSSFALGSNAANGAVAIYTNRGNLRTVNKEPSLPNNRIKGYDAVKNFFSPDYDNKSMPQPDKDIRDQLLWQALIAPTTKADRSKVIFFNNEATQRFRIIVQGFTDNGFPVFFEKIIEPERKAF
jgi:hypothetical protein